MPESPGDRLEYRHGIGEQGEIGGILLGPCRPVGVTGEENMGDLTEIAEFGLAVRRIAEVHGKERRR